MSMSRAAAHWGIHTKNWVLINCDRQCLEQVSRVAADSLQGRSKLIFTPKRDLGDHVVLYNTRRIALEGNQWEEHTYHQKLDWSMKRLKNYYKNTHERADREARLRRNFWITAEEAHLLDPTYVVRAAIYDKLLGGRNSDKDASMARCTAYADRDVPKDILQNINEIADLPPVTKKLSDYSEEERAAFPQLLSMSKEARIYETDDHKEKYFWDKTLADKMGDIGSEEELQFYKEQGFDEFVTEPGEKRRTKVQAFNRIRRKFR